MAGATSMSVTVEGLRFGWRNADQPCLDIPAFAIAPAERVFLHGPSGSGKSTLLAILAGVLAPQAGSVQIGSTELTSLAAGARDAFRANHVGIVFQQFNLLPHLTVLDNVLLPCRFSRRRRLRAAALSGGGADDEALRLLARLGIGPDLAARAAASLSVGQQQRVAAARALIGTPDLIVADEPTSALDIRNTREFLALLLSECCAPSALLLVSHDLSLAAHFDRRIDFAELNRAPCAQAEAG